MISDQIEFTSEGMSAIHQEWIVKLYVDNRKTEAEITHMLSSQKLIITLDQVQKCIQDWNLQPLTMPPPPLYPSMPELDQQSSSYTTTHPPASTRSNRNSRLNPNSTPRLFNSLLHNSQTTKTLSINLHITPINPPDQDIYNNRPLPRLPQTLPSSRSSTSSIPSSPQDCIHGCPPSECLELRFGLKCLPTTGLSSLELYTDTVQFHEKIAMSLSRDKDQRERKVMEPTVHVVEVMDESEEDEGEGETAIHEIRFTKANDLVRKEGRVEAVPRLGYQKERKRKRTGSGEDSGASLKRKEKERDL